MEEEDLELLQAAEASANLVHALRSIDSAEKRKKTVINLIAQILIEEGDSLVESLGMASLVYEIIACEIFDVRKNAVRKDKRDS